MPLPSISLNPVDTSAFSSAVAKSSALAEGVTLDAANAMAVGLVALLSMPASVQLRVLRLMQAAAIQLKPKPTGAGSFILQGYDQAAIRIGFALNVVKAAGITGGIQKLLLGIQNAYIAEAQRQYDAGISPKPALPLFPNA